MPSASIYDSERLAAGYAYSRPRVHELILERVRRQLCPRGERFVRALDVGCGAGLSTAALAPLAAERIGLEPVPAMLKYCRTVAPGARFVVGRAEDLPFADGTFDILTAAGALNYADRTRFLPEAARLLGTRGVLVVYDFSSGRRLADGGSLPEWFAAFEGRYPFPPGYAMDIRTANLADAGFRLGGFEELVVSVPMTLRAYLAYALSETNVEWAVSKGASEAAIREWCEATLGQVFAPGAREVLFDAYVAVIYRV